MIRLRLFHGLSQTYLGVVNSELPSYDCDASIVYEKSFNEGDLLDFRISTPAGIITGSIGSPDDCISCVSRNHAYEVSKEISEEFEELTVGVFFPALVEPRPVADYIYALEDELEDSTLDIISVSTIIDLLTFNHDISVEKVASEIARSEFLCRSIEYSDALIVANSDRVTPESGQIALEIAGQIRANISVIEMGAGGLPLSSFESVPIFDYENELRYSPLTSESNISSVAGLKSSRFVWHAQSPINPERFAAFVDKYLGYVYRSRGNLWFANCLTQQVGWESFSNVYSMDRLDTWIEIGIPAESYLVMLYQNEELTQEELNTALTECLLTDSELNTDTNTWINFSDPLFDAIQKQQG